MNPNALFALDPVTLSHHSRALPREAVQVAMLFDGHRRLWEVVRDSPLAGRMTLSVVGRLAGTGVLGDASQDGTGRAQTTRPRPAIDETEAPTLQISHASLAAALVRPAPPQVTPAPVQAVVAQPAPVSAARPAPVSAAQPAPVQAVEAQPAPASAASAASATHAPSVAFDEHEQRFFESYVPEDAQVDTFWDLEDSPARRLRAKRRAQRQQQGGWFRQVLSLF